MFVITILKIPFFWAAAGFLVGVALGVNNISVWLIAILLLAFLVRFSYFSADFVHSGTVLQYRFPYALS